MEQYEGWVSEGSEDLGIYEKEEECKDGTCIMHGVWSASEIFGDYRGKKVRVTIEEIK